MVSSLEKSGQLWPIVRWTARIGGRHPRLAPGAEQALNAVISTAQTPWLAEHAGRISRALASLGPPGGVRLGAGLMRRLGGARLILGPLLMDAVVSRGRLGARRRETALQLVLVAARTFPSGELPPGDLFFRGAKID